MLLILGLLIGAVCPTLAAAEPATVPASYFREHVQPLFNARCISCHSCFESPCQLNLQTFAGVQRGANPLAVYRGDRLQTMAPSRMFEDASTTAEWRGREFFDVLAGGERSIFWRLIAAADRRKAYPAAAVRESNTCIRTEPELARLEKSHPELAMPYALPALTAAEREVLRTWIRAGAPGEPETLSLDGLAAAEVAVVREWESFLNAKDLKSRVVARYLFEHFFLARFAFPGKHDAHLRLVRSETSCANGIKPVRARQPNDDPGVKEWHYCFYRDPAATVLKKHIPYEISARKLQWLRGNFARESWTAKEFPSFAVEVSRNPFVAFRDIPVAARYRFLLEDARYHIMTFIKGPVCNGSVAVNVIQEQFYVLFMEPSADVMVTDAGFARETEGLLILPGNFEAQEGVVRAFKDFKLLAELRNLYRSKKARLIEKKFPRGLELKHIWDGGGGENPNALLTVFRHDDNAEVLFGAKGDLPRTVFLLDYSVFERLVYNLVVNFDVYGDVKHQALTRLYMDLIRMEAENNYLDFLPPASRLALKKEWYRGTLTRVKLNVLNEDQFPNVPAAIPFAPGSHVHGQMIDKVLHERLSAAVRGVDTLNWKKLRHPEVRPTPETSALRELSSLSVADKAYFAKLMPEFSLLALKRAGRVTKVYSLIRNREHLNISWMFGEEHRLDPDADTLTILEGVKGSYPNDIFVLDAEKLPEFSRELRRIGLARDFESFRRKYSLSRRASDFWSVFDQIQEVHRRQDPAEAGYLDLSRYRMETGGALGGP